MIDPRQLKGAVSYLEMKTRIKMDSSEWFYGFCFAEEAGPSYRYFFFPRVKVKQ